MCIDDDQIYVGIVTLQIYNMVMALWVVNVVSAQCLAKWLKFDQILHLRRLKPDLVGIVTCQFCKFTTVMALGFCQNSFPLKIL